MPGKASILEQFLKKQTTPVSICDLIEMLLRLEIKAKKQTPKTNKGWLQ